MRREILGYDPVDKQYKVLSMTWGSTCGRQEEASHQVLTLGTENPLWRRINCCIPHFPLHYEICINGVLYYQAGNVSCSGSIIICFDVRSETFRFIKFLGSYPRLVNYNGKLGLLLSEETEFVHGRSKSIEL